MAAVIDPLMMGDDTPWMLYIVDAITYLIVSCLCAKKDE